VRTEGQTTVTYQAQQPGGASNESVVLRAADSDRDRTAAILAQAFAEGKLSEAELETRTNACYAATSIADLQTLVADLAAVSRRSQTVLAPPRVRVGAWVCDAGVIFAFTMACGGLITLLPAATGLFGAVILIAPLLYLAGALPGGTLGQRAFGLQLVDSDGTRLRFGRRLTRVLGWLCCLILLPSLLWIIVDRQHQGWHDKLAGALVVQPAR
jgi:uncharacterized RDD family membrane protein YckC